MLECKCINQLKLRSGLLHKHCCNWPLFNEQLKQSCVDLTDYCIELISWPVNNMYSSGTVMLTGLIIAQNFLLASQQHVFVCCSHVDKADYCIQRCG